MVASSGRKAFSVFIENERSGNGTLCSGGQELVITGKRGSKEARFFVRVPPAVSSPSTIRLSN